MSTNKIVPCLWFHTEGGKIAEVIEYYKTVFSEHLQEGSIIPLGTSPRGNTEMCEVTIFEKKYNWTSTANLHNAFNDALALAIYCEDQNEIDKFWNYFTKEGKEVQCADGVLINMGFVGRYCQII